MARLKLTPAGSAPQADKADAISHKATPIEMAGRAGKMEGPRCMGKVIAGENAQPLGHGKQLTDNLCHRALDELSELLKIGPAAKR